MENINSSYFDGFYKDIWKSIVPVELTSKEADFIIRHFNLQPGSRVLDLMCGYGRHALALAEKGIEVTAVDNLEEYISELKQNAKRLNLPVEAVKTDVVVYEPDGNFDLVLCMGNSLCFFDRDDTIRLMKMISRHLRIDGCFFINSWMIAEIAFNDFREKSWSNIGDLKYITESKFLLQPSRIETEHLVLAPGGQTETKKAIDYIYSIGEMELMLAEAGLSLDEVYSIPGRKKFTLGDPRAYFIARKQ